MTHSGLHWTAPEHDAIVDLRARGLTAQQIADTLTAAGVGRSMVAIKQYIRKVDSGLPRPFDPALAAAGIDLGAIDAPVNTRIKDNMIQPIYQPDRPAPVAPEIVPVGKSRVGVIGDTHLPFTLPEYLPFLQETFHKWGVNTVVHIGDLLDNHAISFHKPDPDGRSAGDEYQSAIDALGPWYRAFPNVKWIVGNHDALPARKIFDAGLPANMLRTNYYQAPPGWSSAESYEIDGVLYTHGIGCGGVNGHRLLSQKRGQSCVIGHIHMTAGVAYQSAHDGIQRFGLAVGCGVDHESYAMAYARYFGRPSIGCGIVLGGR